MNKKCDKCGHPFQQYVWTDYFRACCPVQFLRIDELICFNCLEVSTAILVYYRLKNPIKDCDSCEGSDYCPGSKNAEDSRKKNAVLADGIDDHTSVWGGAGPDCMAGRLVSA